MSVPIELKPMKRRFGIRTVEENPKPTSVPQNCGKPAVGQSIAAKGYFPLVCGGRLGVRGSAGPQLK